MLSIKKPFSSTVYVGTLAVSLLAIFWLVGCASVREREPSDVTPRSIEDVQREPRVPRSVADHRPSVALVLGGGGLRGFAHLGVLRALEEAGVQPDIVVGTSAGAVVGAAYASGLSPEAIESIARNVELSSLVDLTFSSSGLMRGDSIANWIDHITSGVPIERFPRRFAAVATDLRSGKPVMIDRGLPGVAVQASAAVPGVTVPFAYMGGHLVDGGIASLVPVRFARAMGADFVIAVDIYCRGPSSEGIAAPSILLQVMHVQSCHIAAAEMAEADVLIAPSIRVPGMSAKDEQDGAINAGYEAAIALLPRIKSQVTATDRLTLDSRPIVAAAQ